MTEPLVMRIHWSSYEVATKVTTSEWLDIPLVCEEKDCDSRSFDVHNSGYAWYTTYLEIDDCTNQVYEHDSETDVGDDFECDNEWRCNACGSYCSNKLAQALKEFSRLRKAKPEDQLKAYLDNAVFKPVNKEKEALLEGLAYGLAAVKFNKEEDKRIEDAVKHVNQFCPRWDGDRGVCRSCGEAEAIHVLASFEFCLVCDGNGWPDGYCTHDSDVPGK